MFVALLLSGALMVADQPEAPAAACAPVTQMKGKMMPASSSDPQAAVVHGALLYFGDAFAGAVYGTRAGNVFYQGSGKFSDPVSSSAHDRAMTMLGISNASGTFVAAPKPSFADALAPDVRLKGCF